MRRWLLCLSVITFTTCSHNAALVPHPNIHRKNEVADVANLDSPEADPRAAATVLSGAAVGLVGSILGAQNYDPSQNNILANVGLGAVAGLAVNTVLEKLGHDGALGTQDVIIPRARHGIVPFREGMKIEYLGRPTLLSFLYHARESTEDTSVIYNHNGELEIVENFVLVIGYDGKSHLSETWPFELFRILIDLKERYPAQIYWVSESLDLISGSTAVQLEHSTLLEFLKLGHHALLIGDTFIAHSIISYLIVKRPTTSSSFTKEPTVEAWVERVDIWMHESLEAQTSGLSSPMRGLDSCVGKAEFSPLVKEWLKKSGVKRYLVSHGTCKASGEVFYVLPDLIVVRGSLEDIMRPNYARIVLTEESTDVYLASSGVEQPAIKIPVNAKGGLID